MKNLFFSLLIVCQCYIGLSQTDDINHRKYWYYRSRLTNDFMKIGPKQGESLPFSCRGKYGNGYGDPTSLYSQVGTDVVSQLGPYICVLATEYKLLKDNNQPTDSTLREIYYAMEAFNRLDYNGESVYGYAKNFDGFFIRTDVSKTLVTDNMDHFNYDGVVDPSIKSTAGGFCSPSHNADLIFNADPLNPNHYSSEEPFCRYQDVPNTFNKVALAMSLDQVVNMFNAFALINKYFSSETYKINGVDQMFSDGITANIRNEARIISQRIISALQGGGDWKILMPGGNHVSSGNGGHVFPYSWAFSEASCKIQKSNGTNNSVELCVNGMTGSGIANFLSASAGFAVWKANVTAGAILDLVHKDNAPKTVGLEAACNCNYVVNFTQLISGWVNSVISYIIGWIHYFTSGSPQPVFSWQEILGNNTDVLMLDRIIPGWTDLQWASLLRKIIHGGSNNAVFNYKNFLDTAPCDGPRYYSTDSNNPNFRWLTVDNIDHADDRSTNAEFNGIDYMLYHNLWYIDQGYGSTPPVDLRYRYINVNFPVASINVGSNINPAYIPAYEYVTANNTINAFNSTNQSDPNNGNATYRAGKIIHFEPGFNVSAGAFFHGYIQKFGCVSGNDISRLAGGSDSIQKSNNYSDSSIYVQPTSFVHYPTEEVSSEPLVRNQPKSNVKKIYKNENTSSVFSHKLIIYPNPNNGVFSLEFNLIDNENATISITDVLNNVILKQERSGDGINKVEVDIKDFSKGVYLVKFSSNKGNNSIDKIIIQ